MTKVAHCHIVSLKLNGSIIRGWASKIWCDNSENEFTAWLLSLSHHDSILTGEPGLPVGPGRPWCVKEDNAAFIARLIFLEQNANNWHRTTYISSISAVFTRGPPGTFWAGRAWWALDRFVRLRSDVNPAANGSEMVKSQWIRSGISSSSANTKCLNHINIAGTVSIRLWGKNNSWYKCILSSRIWVRVLECRQSNIGH